MSPYEIFINVWWVIVVVVVGFFEHRLGRKLGRREGYVEGHGHGQEDTFRQLGVPFKRNDEGVVVIDARKFFAVRGRNRPS